MKKILTLVLAITLMVPIFGFNKNSVYAASTTSDSITLTTGLTSKSTVRVSTSNGLLEYLVMNTGRYKVSFRIFIDGVGTGKIYLAPGESLHGNLHGTLKNEFSLRVYCESGLSSGTGCSAAAGIEGR